ncbi:substrate-binding periplasmic protein [Rheinheimera marina]|uniref:Substrate-binding periplasmic protein n=1 Tax=Rheinheimera marina TaxID=1774958 RepID=A0ABV9JMY0_9GAMM
MTQRRARDLLSLLLGLGLAGSAYADLTLNAAVSETNTAPYAIFSESGTLTAGLAKDLLDRLAVRLDARLNYLNLPRGRVTDWLLDGRADIGCFLSPDWVRVPGLAWTPVLFHTQQLIIRRKGSARVYTAVDLRRKRIGTTRGFVYPELSLSFSTGQAVRDDAASLESNLQRLKQGRVDLVMSVDLSYGYLQKTAPDPELEADPLWAEPVAVYCGLNPAKPQLVLAIQQQFELMKKAGELEPMLAKWGRYQPEL